MKRRFYWITAFLLVALMVAVWATVQRIEGDLLIRTQQAVAAAGIPYYDLRIDGRDAVLTGFVQDETQIERLQTAVATVPGVARVRSQLAVERVVEPAPLSGAATVAAERPGRPRGRPPRLRLQRLGTAIFGTGSLPEGGSDDLLAALRLHFRESDIRVVVADDPGVARLAWIDEFNSLTDVLAQLGEPAVIAAHGASVQVSGRVRSDRDREALDELVARTPEVAWRLSLVNPHGGVGGAP